MPTQRVFNPIHPPRYTHRLVVFIGLSVLIHVLLVFSLLHRHEEMMLPAQSATRGPLEVHVLPPAPPSAPAVPASKPEPQPQPEPQPKSELRPKPQPQQPLSEKPKSSRRHVAKSRPVPPQNRVEPQAPIATRPAPPAGDMMDMINAARARRRAAQEAATGTNSPAETNEPAPSSNDVALANIKRDLQRNSTKWDGEGGLFRIISKGPRMATFQFRGWSTVSHNRWQQTIEVDAGPNGDVEHAIVRRMIALIRERHNGDFNWESHRLGRVLVLSARPEDNAQLEEFLMEEFFSS